jgi:hypothetical protein
MHHYVSTAKPLGQCLRRKSTTWAEAWLRLSNQSSECEGQGEALSEALKAKEAWVESARKHYKPIPEPHYRPVIYQVA